MASLVHWCPQPGREESFAMCDAHLDSPATSDDPMLVDCPPCLSRLADLARRTRMFGASPTPGRCRILVEGGRHGEAPLSRGADIGVVAASSDGTRLLLPVTSMTIRVANRRAVATVDLEVTDIDLDSIAVGAVVDGVHRSDRGEEGDHG